MFILYYIYSIKIEENFIFHVRLFFNMKKYKIALIQMFMTDSMEHNIQKALDFLEVATNNGAKVVCLPELFKNQYFCQQENPDNFNLAEDLTGSTFELFKNFAKEKNIVLIYPFFEQRTSGIYHNSLAVIDTNGSSVGIYRKMHIPDDPGYYEKYYFTPGDQGFKSFKTEIDNIGALICWDQWFPEAARLVSLKGANIIFYPTAIGWHPDEKAILGKNQLDAWKTIQRGHAISNGIYIAAVNRVGIEQIEDSKIEFWGNSFICNPQGSIIAEASNDKEEIIYTEIDLDKLEDIRRNWPFLRDRRIDSYSGLNQLFIDDEFVSEV